jgi:hypothetical protein
MIDMRSCCSAEVLSARPCNRSSLPVPFDQSGDDPFRLWQHLEVAFQDVHDVYCGLLGRSQDLIELVRSLEEKLPGVAVGMVLGLAGVFALGREDLLVDAPQPASEFLVQGAVEFGVQESPAKCFGDLLVEGSGKRLLERGHGLLCDLVHDLVEQFVCVLMCILPFRPSEPSFVSRGFQACSACRSPRGEGRLPSGQ